MSTNLFAPLYMLILQLANSVEQGVRSRTQVPSRLTLMVCSRDSRPSEMNAPASFFFPAVHTF